jgi:hypothetical protein
MSSTSRLVSPSRPGGAARSIVTGGRNRFRRLARTCSLELFHGVERIAEHLLVEPITYEEVVGRYDAEGRGDTTRFAIGIVGAFKRIQPGIDMPSRYLLQTSQVLLGVLRAAPISLVEAVESDKGPGQHRITEIRFDPPSQRLLPPREVLLPERFETLHESLMKDTLESSFVEKHAHPCGKLRGKGRGNVIDLLGKLIEPGRAGAAHRGEPGRHKVEALLASFDIEWQASYRINGDLFVSSPWSDLAEQGPSWAIPRRRLRNLEEDFAAIIAPGLDLAFQDVQAVELRDMLPGGGKAVRTIQVCGPAAIIVLKALAFDKRGKPKDAYDLFHVLRSHADAIERIGNKTRSFGDHPDAREAIGVLQRDFRLADSVGPARVAEFLGGPDDDLQAEVAGLVRSLLDTLV